MTLDAAGGPAEGRAAANSKSLRSVVEGELRLRLGLSHARRPGSSASDTGPPPFGSVVAIRELLNAGARGTHTLHQFPASGIIAGKSGSSSASRSAPCRSMGRGPVRVPRHRRLRSGHCAPSAGERGERITSAIRAFMRSSLRNRRTRCPSPAPVPRRGASEGQAAWPERPPSACPPSSADPRFGATHRGALREVRGRSRPAVRRARTLRIAGASRPAIPRDPRRNPQPAPEKRQKDRHNP